MQASILRHITPRSGTSSAIRDSPGVESSVARKAERARSSTSTDSATVRMSVPGRTPSSAARSTRGVGSSSACRLTSAPVSQKREPLARLGLKGIDLLRSVSRAQIEGPAAREMEPRVPGDALPHCTEVERLHGLSPQPLVTAEGRRPVAVLLNRCHGVVLPTVRFYQQAPPGPRARPADSGHVTIVFRRKDGRSGAVLS